MTFIAMRSEGIRKSTAMGQEVIMSKDWVFELKNRRGRCDCISSARISHCNCRDLFLELRLAPSLARCMHSSHVFGCATYLCIIRGCIRCHRAKVMSLWQQDHQKKDCTRVCIGSV
ncbi:hypothetical protein C5167_011482 [Papaver somniferum]|uniref:Uncharacterized protein n=1 Tax=Papaver somniferum TaxID=3469 RepID=A0A4Y7K6F1_PAPSO|nr:hypothetical protein C5167_011482 [Papaver somniferum]